jgi:iron complex outermembrane receptor protein
MEMNEGMDPRFDDVVYLNSLYRNDRDKAIFGSVSFDVTEDIELTVGTRYFEPSVSVKGFFGFGLGFTPIWSSNGENRCNLVQGEAGWTPDFNGQADWNNKPCLNVDKGLTESENVSRVNATWNVTDDHMVYFTWSEGYRPGGVNRALEGQGYDEDFVTNWELGWKTTWLDNRMRFNGATYYMDWEDFQYSSLDLGSGQPLTVINNAGQADIYGLEFDLDYAITNAFTFSFSGSFIDAESTEAIKTEDGIIPKGEMPYTPEVQLSSILRYGTELGEYGVYAQGAWSYSDGVITDLDPVFALETDSYNIVNLAFGIARNSWHLDLFIDNATDERAELDNTNSYPKYEPSFNGAIKSASFYNTNRPRSIGLRFGQKF